MNKQEVINKLNSAKQWIESALELLKDEDVPPPPPPPPPPNGGSREFTFTRPTNGQPYPPDDAGNGYVRCFFPSHAIIAIPVGQYREGLIAGVEYELMNDRNERVLYVKDDLGGFHPNYFDDPSASRWETFRKWVLNFRGDSVFGSARDKGNNHLGGFDGYLPEGIYYWRVKNIGSAPFQMFAGKIRSGNGKDVVDDYTISPGETRTITFVLQKGIAEDSKFDPFKFNLNAYHY